MNSNRLPMYVIRWTNPNTGKTGTGTGKFPYTEAQRYCDAMNREEKFMPPERGRVVYSVERAKEKDEEK